MLRAWSRWAPLTGLVSAVLGVAGAAIEIMTNPPGSDANTPLAGLGGDRNGGRGGDSSGRFFIPCPGRLDADREHPDLDAPWPIRTGADWKHSPPCWSCGHLKNPFAHGKARRSTRTAWIH